MRYITLLLCLFILSVYSCGSSRSAADRDADTVERYIKNGGDKNTVNVDAGDSGVDLTTYLRRVAGVSVRGTGANATIRIRGDVNAQSDSTPLFVIDGTVLGNNFASVYNTIDINDIDKVRVLKNVSDTNRYGMQGANGVIEIEMKKK